VNASRGTPAAVSMVLGGVLSVQLGAALAKSLFPELGPEGTVFVRLAAAALVLGVITRRGPLSVVRTASRAPGPTIAFGAVLALMNLSFYLSLDRIPLGIAVTVEFLGPMAIAVWGARRARDFAWPALAVLGVVALTDAGAALTTGRLDPVGMALAAVAGACWACYILLSKRVGEVVPGVGGLVVALTVGALLLAPGGITRAGAAFLDVRLVLLGCGVGVLSAAVPFALELVALRRLPARTFGVLMSLELVVAALVGLVFLGERLGRGDVLGVLLVAVASAGAVLAAPSGRSGPVGPQPGAELSVAAPVVGEPAVAAGPSVSGPAERDVTSPTTTIAGGRTP